MVVPLPHLGVFHGPTGLGHAATAARAVPFLPCAPKKLDLGKILEGKAMLTC